MREGLRAVPAAAPGWAGLSTKCPLMRIVSPIGAALMGKKVGEIAEARVPSGTLRLRIESITLDEG